MLITKDHITASIYKMIGAGKKVPEQPGKSAREAMEILVDLWWGLFGDKQIGVERWDRAADIAITTTSAGMINVNYITPALMSYALDQEMKEHLVNQQAQAAKHKDLKVDIQGNTYQCRSNDYLWKWTVKKLAVKSAFMENMPSDEAVFKFAQKYGIPCERPSGKNTVAGFNYALIQTYLSDHHNCNSNCNPAKCYLKKQKPQMNINGSELSFEFVACGA